MPFLVVLFLLAALWLFWLASRRRKSSGMPGGRVIYADTRLWGEVQEPLYDPILGLTGKPDYLVEQGETIIPVEVKSSQIGQAPYDSHIYQLAAYCLLVDRVLGKRPPYGILHYANRTFAIDFTPQLETALIDVLVDIRSHNEHKQVLRSHTSLTRCTHCGFHSICDQALQ